MNTQELIVVSEMMSGIDRINVNKLKFTMDKMEYHLENAIDGLKKLDDLYGEMIKKLNEHETQE